MKVANVRAFECRLFAFVGQFIAGKFLNTFSKRIIFLFFFFSELGVKYLHHIMQQYFIQFIFALQLMDVGMFVWVKKRFWLN